VIETIKIKPSDPEQGEYVIINADDFDPSVHTRLDDEAQPKRGRKAKDEA
jgi:hypothetical protein